MKKISTKLTVEFVPSSSHYKNVRSNVKKKEWDKIRRQVYKEAGYKCEICGGVGKRHPVECHEVFEYNDTKGIQKLVRFEALCNLCHMVKHFGRSEMIGKRKVALYHLIKVNGWTEADAELYLEAMAEQWIARSQLLKWELDLCLLKEYNIDVDKESGD